MRENLGDYYKFTKRGARANIIFMGIIPLALGYLGYSTIGKYTFDDKRRSQPIYEDYVPRKL